MNPVKKIPQKLREKNTALRGALVAPLRAVVWKLLLNLRNICFNNGFLSVIITPDTV
jgi:hypothetical protein